MRITIKILSYKNAKFNIGHWLDTDFCSVFGISNSTNIDFCWVFCIGIGAKTNFGSVLLIDKKTDTDLKYTYFIGWEVWAPLKYILHDPDLKPDFFL